MRRVLLQLLFISSLAVLSGCEKGATEPFPPAENQEKTVVLLPAAEDGPLMTLALDLNPGVVTVNILEIRRDATSPADLNRRLVVKIKDQDGVLSDETSGEVERMSPNLYTVHPDNPYDGQFWTVTFEPGETVKYIKILLDPSTLITLGKRVGFGFVIADASGATISGDKSKLAVEISAKNPWDGVYTISGTFSHADPCLTGPFGTPTTVGAAPYPLEIQLITIGATSVKRNLLGLENLVVHNNCTNGLTYFTNVIPAYQIDPVTNNVTVLSRPGSTVTWNITGPMVYNPGTKTFTLNYGYLGTPNRVIKETMVWVRSR